MTDTTVARGGGVAVWRQIADALRAELASGGMRPGEKLPTEPELAARFGVHRHTLRQAVASLVEAGHLRVEQGRGTFVATPVIDYALGSRTRMSANLAAQGLGLKRTLLRLSPIKATAELAATLSVKKGAPLLHTESTSEADGAPITVGEQWIVMDLAPGIEAAYRELSSLTQAFARCGVADYTRAWTRVTARPPTRIEAQLLGQPQNRPVLCTEGLDVDPQKRPLVLGRTAFCADRVQLVIGEG
ncbi:MAG: phosphonate metabolism transcriptional regulator PhnF [Elsteraceae bacterium]